MFSAKQVGWIMKQGRMATKVVRDKREIHGFVKLQKRATKAAKVAASKPNPWTSGMKGPSRLDRAASGAKNHRAAIILGSLGAYAGGNGAATRATREGLGKTPKGRTQRGIRVGKAALQGGAIGALYGSAFTGLLKR